MEKSIDVTVEAMRQAVVSFLDAYGEESLLGADFTALLEGRGDKAGSAVEIGGQRVSGQAKFENLLQATGLDETGFFQQVAEQLETANHLQPGPIEVGG